MDHVINQIRQEDAKVSQVSTFLRQKRLNWYGHIRRREVDHLSRNDGHERIGEEKNGRPRRRWIDNNRRDMNKYELTADMSENRQNWKMMVKTSPKM